MSLISMSKPISLTAMSAAILIALTGCGSDNDGSDNTVTKPDSPRFQNEVTWTVSGDSLAPNRQTCFDFDSGMETPCDADTWDIKFDNQMRGVNLWSNSGTSGEGNGGVFGLIDWSELKTYKNGIQDPNTNSDITHHYSADKSGGIFDSTMWYAYDLNGEHKLYPNNRVYLITSDSTSAMVESQVQQPIYALQIVNYYNAIGQSGHPTIRWIDTALPTQTKERTVDATSYDDWTYLNLTSNQVVDRLSDWHIAFKRDSIKLNGGASGDGSVGGFVAATPDGYYDDHGEPITAKFMTDNKQESLVTLTNTAAYDKPTSARGWVTDSNHSALNPSYSGTYPNLDFGWYIYNGATHQLLAKPMDSAQGALIRSAEGDSYARMRLAEINYPEATATQASSWVFTFDVQPAK